MNLKNIKCLILDVDGVLTDGSLFYSKDGEILKRFNVKDGFGLSLAKKAGLILCIITARNSDIVKKRAEDLNFDECFIGQHHKIESYNIIKKNHLLRDEECAFIGDDIIDLKVLKSVGFSACPADAVQLVREKVDYVAESNGGNGAVREIIEYILKRSGQLDTILETYTS